MAQTPVRPPRVSLRSIHKESACKSAASHTFSMNVTDTSILKSYSGISLTTPTYIQHAILNSEWPRESKSSKRESETTAGAVNVV